jgi:2-oxoglutarate ferredoxin oxidoreductase subunit beta
MTGGQSAPTTSIGDFTSTSPYGNIEPPFNLVSLAAASGASYVARWPGYDTLRLKDSIMKSMDNPGFSFIEVLAPCFTQYGRKNKLGDAVEMLEWLQKQVVIRKDCPPHEAIYSHEQGKIVCGEFVNSPREGFSQKIKRLTELVQSKKK